MRFAEKRFAYDPDFSTLRQCSQSRTQARSTGADDQHIMLVSFEFCRHKILRSEIAPLATSRTYRSVRPTVIKLIQA